jgi:hypothetical protein
MTLFGSARFGLPVMRKNLYFMSEILHNFLRLLSFPGCDLNFRIALRVRCPTMLWRFFLTLGLAIASCASGSAAQVATTGHPATPARIFADPDLRVSYDGDVVHMEAYAAASATNPDLLVAGGELIVPGRRLNATEARLYVSTDAGARWNPVPLPDEVNGGWDNAVAGGAADSAYFLTSNSERGLTLYHTNDAAKTWTSTLLTAAVGWDRPHVAVDVTSSPYRGRFYVAGEAEDGVRVMTSSDAGKTFSSPVTVCAHPPGWNAATDSSPLVLSDGTIVVPCAPYPNDPERATWTAADVGIVTSGDGGRTFTPYRKLGVVHRALDGEMYAARVRGDVILSGNFMQGPSFAVSPPRTLFADRIYAAWQDIDSTGGSRLLLSWSADRGVNWSAPLPVDSSQATDAKRSGVRQGVPMVAVNRDGVLGVAWFDGRHSENGQGYDVFFSASLDGGRTFLPSVRVSTATSKPGHGLNTVPAFDAAAPLPNGEIPIHMVSPFSQRATGADYSSMPSDAAGRFHPFWTDARDGAWQLYSATVRVITGEALAEITARSAEEPSSAVGACHLDSGKIELIFGEPKRDSTGNEVVVPVRLLNNSPQLILRPIIVRVASKMPESEWTKVVPGAAALVPKIFDPFRAVLGDNATFVYPISSDSPLFPGGVTAPLDWTLHVPAPQFMNFSLQAKITGSGCPPE